METDQLEGLENDGRIKLESVLDRWLVYECELGKEFAHNRVIVFMTDFGISECSRPLYDTTKYVVIYLTRRRIVDSVRSQIPAYSNCCIH